MTLLHRLASMVRWIVNRDQSRGRPGRRTAGVRRHGRRRPGPRRRDARRGPPPGRAPAGRGGAGEGARANRSPWRLARRGRPGRPLWTAAGPTRSGVLGDRDRDARARHRRDYGDVQRLRRGADPPAALRRCGPSRDDLGRDGQDRRHVETQPHTRGMDRVAPSQYRVHGSRVQSARRRDALGRRRTRAGSRAEGHLDLLERARCAADAWPCLHRGRGQQERARRRDQPRTVAAALRRRIRHHRTQDLAQRRALRSDRRHAARTSTSCPRARSTSGCRRRSLRGCAGTSPGTTPRSSRGSSPASRWSTPAVHGGIESAGDGEGFPRPAFGDRHASAGRDRGQNTNRADPAAERVGGAAADRLRQSDESPAVARRGARPRSRGARRAWRGPRQAGRSVPDRKPGARRVRHACRTRARPSRHAISRTARARGHGRCAPHARLARAGVFRRPWPSPRR